MRDILPYSLNLDGQLIELSEPLVMGILNVTPDSFYAESRRQTEADIAKRAEQIVSEGGSIIDIGGYSTRPGAADVPEEEELARLSMALTIVRRTAPDTPLSIDTFRANVAHQCFDEFGPAIVNDVTGGSDPDMFPLVARLGLPYVLTCPTASPFNADFAEKLSRLRSLGQKDIILDPGFGFGKTLDENYVLMNQWEALKTFELPLLVGISRKSMIYRLLDCQPQDALNGTTVLHTMALERGAHLLRVHDVAACREAIKIVAAVHRKSSKCKS